jgi:hypothetical protein
MLKGKDLTQEYSQSRDHPMSFVIDPEAIEKK